MTRFEHRLLALLLAFSSLATAATPEPDGTMYPMDVPDEPGAIALDTGGVDDQTAEESWFRQWGDPMARNISRATLTPFLADPKQATGASVIVAPGGGFMWLSMGNEGWEVARALADRGINAFVLKYRLQPTAPKLEDFEGQMKRRFEEAAQRDGNGARPRRPSWDLSNPVADVEAAFALIRRHADAWNVDLDRVGMLGFSAGAGLTMETTLRSKKVDLAFIATLYGMLGPVEVPKDAPPLFVAIATDDFLFRGETGLIKSWYDAGRPVELHLYQNGGHGFGLGNPDRTSNRWFEAYIHWLDVNGFLRR